MFPVSQRYRTEHIAINIRHRILQCCAKISFDLRLRHFILIVIILNKYYQKSDVTNITPITLQDESKRKKERKKERKQK